MFSGDYMKPKIVFCKNLYVSKSLENKSWFIKWKLRHFAGFLRLYLLVVSDNPNEQLEIMHASLLRQSYYKEHPTVVVGFSKTRREAFELVTQITQKVYSIWNNAELKKYIQQENERIQL